MSMLGVRCLYERGHAVINILGKMRSCVGVDKGEQGVQERRGIVDLNICAPRSYCVKTCRAYAKARGEASASTRLDTRLVEKGPKE